MPDFRAILADQFAVLQSRIDDALRSTPAGERWLTDDATGYAVRQAPPDAAAVIADEELADLKQWLEQRWNATPRDTKALQTLLKYLPGGSKLVKWTEAAPYLLTLVLVTHGAVFGHLDLIVLGGYGLATWLTERLSNEVTARTRTTNTRIADRFAALGQDQIERVCALARPPRPVEEDAGATGAGGRARVGASGDGMSRGRPRAGRRGHRPTGSSRSSPRSRGS